MTSEHTPGALDGVLVADFSRVLAGPYATMMLADLGATVIKVEGPGGDDTRGWKPPIRDGESTYFMSANRNKDSLVLDFRDPDELALAVELARRADVVVENFKPGGLKKYGLDHESVARLNPACVYASISGFGPGNPQPGYDLLVQGLSGFMSVTGDADGPPQKAGMAIFDVMTGLHTVIGILAALRHREATGEGQHVQTNLLSSALSGLVNQASAYVAGGVVPHRMGNEHPSLYPYAPFPTGEGDLILACGNDAQFRVLARVLGHPDLAEDPRFVRNADRTVHRAELGPRLEDALSLKTAQEWYALLTEAGVPCAPINTVAQGVELAESLGLNPVVVAGGAAAGTVGDGIPTIANPIDLSATPARYTSAPPRFDASGEELRAWLREG